MRTVEPMYRLWLLGSPCVTGAENHLHTGRAAQRHRLALLALLALAPPPGMSRDKLLGLLWPRRDTAHGRNLLKQAVYVIRSTFGHRTIRSAGNDIYLDTTTMAVDVLDYQAALERSDHHLAVTLYRGPFLDGFFLLDAPEFERWAEQRRERFALSRGRALEALARAAEAEGDLEKAIEHWRGLADHDPYDSRIALHLMQAFAAAGNPAAALQHAETHARVLQHELRALLPREVADLAERIRTGRSRTPVRPESSS